MPLPFAGPLAALLLAPTCLNTSQLGQPGPSIVFHGVNPGFLDRRVSPTADFYRFSNGSWLDKARIPNDEANISATAQARQRNEEMIWKIVAPTVYDNSAVAGSPEQIVGEFIRTGLDQNLADRLRAEPIQPELRRIEAIQTRGDLVSELARLHRLSIGVGFCANVSFDFLNSSHKILSLSQAGLSLRRRSPYLDQDDKARSLRTRLSAIIEKSLLLVGDSPPSVSRSARRVLAIETRLAEASVPESETGSVEQNFHRLSLSQLQGLAPNIDWPRYLKELGSPDSIAVNVEQPIFLKAFSELVGHVPIRDWRIYLRWRLTSSASPFLSSQLAEQSFQLQSALMGQEFERSRSEVVLEEADACLGNELGQLLCRTGFGLHAKGKVVTMVQSIRAAIRDKIEHLDWMGPVTRRKALEKLDKMQVGVCYPERWRDSTELVINDSSFLENVFRAREFEFQRQLNKIGKPIDRSDWDVRSYAVDARYSPSLNAIILPAGILQPPYFDIEADDASNYGSFGTVIGHEMMHAFDGRGRKFDSEGNLKNWWSKLDGLQYDMRQRDFVAQYDGYHVRDNLHINGKLTLEENVADLGGVTAAFAAFRRSSNVANLPSSDGFTPDQRFFISFGQLFRNKIRPESERMTLESDPHAPPEFRVNGVLQNCPEFYKAFHVAPPKTQLRIW